MTRIHTINKLLISKNYRFEEVCDNAINTTYFHSNNSIIFNTQFHSAYGSIMPGRYFSSGTGYRYGFNGKEMDNEISGNGNQYDYGFRIYNPRLGKFLSVDPLTKDYPFYTPYQFASNTPICAIDVDGGEAKIVIIYHNRNFLSTVHHIQVKFIPALANVTANGSVFTSVYHVYLKDKNHPYHEKTTDYGRSMDATIYENIPLNKNELKPSYYYDYTSNSSMMQKRIDDWNYILGGNTITNMLFRSGEIAVRDANAPDNFEAINDVVLASTALRGNPFAAFLSESQIINRIRTAESVNSAQVASGQYSSWKTGTSVIESTVNSTTKYVRVHGANMKGAWVTTESEILGLTPEQIKDKFSLKYVPTHVTDVTLGAGTQIRTGIAGKVVDKGGVTWGNGGGMQIEIISNGENAAYSNTRSLQ